MFHPILILFIFSFSKILATAYSDVQKNLTDSYINRNSTTYQNGMDASIAEKIRRIVPHISQSQNEIVDIGSGTGALSAHIASLFPNTKIIGIDLNPEMIATSTKRYHHLTNLRFKLASANKQFSKEADTVIYSSILHEIFSYSNYQISSVQEALKICHLSMKTGGRVIIRAFIKPEEPSQKVILFHKLSDIRKGHSFEDFARSFKPKIKFTPLKNKDYFASYETEMQWAYEYMYRKDFHNNWESELLERYGFWTEKEALSLLENSGFKIIHKERINNPWIKKNRLDNKVYITTADKKSKLPLPDYQILLVGEAKS